MQSLRLEPEIADWFCKESLRTDMPVATMQRLILTQYARTRMREAEQTKQPRESRFKRSSYLGG